jgi:hypothetical protein
MLRISESREWRKSYEIDFFQLQDIHNLLAMMFSQIEKEPIHEEAALLSSLSLSSFPLTRKS